jgi:hypothetical protein
MSIAVPTDVIDGTSVGGVGGCIGFTEPNTMGGSPTLIVKVTVSTVVMLLHPTHWFGGVDSGSILGSLVSPVTANHH